MLALEGLEHFSLDGTEYEAFNTSGGLGTLTETWAGKVQTLDYKSVRYPGHQALMKMLLEELQLNKDTDTLKDIMRKSIPSTMQDVVLVFVTVSGLRNGQLVQEVFARKIFADRNEAAPLSADPDHHRRGHLRPRWTCSAKAGCRRAASSARSRSNWRPSWPTASAALTNRAGRSSR